MKFSTLAAAAAAVSTLGLAAAAHAETSFYGNLGYTYVDADGPKLGAIDARVGARLHKYFGAEVEGGLGVNDDHVNVAGVNVKTELKHSAAVYGVGFLPVSDQFELFARLGYGTTKIKASAAGFGASDSEESWNYGVGGQYFFDAVNGVRGEYTRYDFNGSGGEADTWAVSYVRKF